MPSATILVTTTLALAPLTSFGGFSRQETTFYGPELTDAERQTVVETSHELFRHKAMVQAVFTLPQLFAKLAASEHPGSNPSGGILTGDHANTPSFVTQGLTGEPQPLAWNLAAPAPADDDQALASHPWITAPRSFALPRLTGQAFVIDATAADFDGGGPMFENDAFPPCGLIGNHLEQLLSLKQLPTITSYWREAKVSQTLARQLAPIIRLARKPDPFGERRYDYGGYFNSEPGRTPDTYDPGPVHAIEPIPENIEVEVNKPKQLRRAPPPRMACDEQHQRPARELIRGAIDRYGAIDLVERPGIAVLAQDLRLIDRCYRGQFEPIRRAAEILDQLTSLVPDLQAACTKVHGRFQELHGAGSYLDLLSCHDPGGKPIGPFLRWYEDGRIIATYSSSQQQLRLTGNPSSREVRLSGRLGPELVFDTEGRPRLLRARKGYPATEWYPTGPILLQDRGNEATIWYADGRIAVTSQFDQTRSLTRVRRWHPNGRLGEDIRFMRGKPHGILRWWHANGRLAGQARLVNGSPHGDVNLYFADGRPGFQTRYQAGELDGRIAYFHPDGSKALNGIVRDGEWDGELTVRLNAAVPLFVRRFKRGKPIGTWIDYNPLLPGKPLRTIALASGSKLAGLFQAYSVHGGLKSQCKVTAGRITQIRAWHPNGATLAQAVRDPNHGGFRLQVANALRQPLFACQGLGIGQDKGAKAAAVANCSVNASGRFQRTRLGDEALFFYYAGQDALTWRPQACGGYRVAEYRQNVSLRDFEQSRALWVEQKTFQALGVCPTNHANELTCTIHYLESGPKIHSCVGKRK